MKRAVILHGTDGSPDINWFPWLQNKLETNDYEVWTPLLPDNHTPNREVYNNFLFNSEWDFTDNVIVGHSSGAVSVLNLLMNDRCPKLKLAVIVSAWKGGVPEGMEAEQFENLFPPNGFDFEKINQKTEKIVFLHSDNDPYCPLEQAKWLAEKLEAPITVMHNAGHIGRQFNELPEIWKLIAAEL
jgi:predicted alpha/beta hydrolase family esterase